MAIDMSDVDDLVARGYTLDDVLEHYGVKGMSWGKRKRPTSEPDDAEDHTRARTLHTVAKTKGTRKLTNKDLEDLNKRLNLEQNYSSLTSKKKERGTIATGASWIGKRLGNVGGSIADEVLKANVKQALLIKGVIPNGGKK